MDRLTYFQAAHLSDQESIDQFVVRQHELDLLLSDIRENDMSGSIQHYVLIGQRGSGKSTLLRRIEAEISTDKSLAKRLIAVNLSEEQAGIYRLHDLWDRTAQELIEKGVAVEPVDWTRYENDRVALARASYSALQAALKKADRKLVLLLDNIDRIFQNLDKQEAHLFRELLINYKDVRIIGGSTRLSEHHWKYDQPFYEFFRLLHLEPLTSAEMKALLTTWADRLKMPEIHAFMAHGDGRLEALRILSDGMPRTMLNLLELMAKRPNEDSYEYLRYIVDKATAIYQERLGTLSPHQKKVLLELSFFWEAASAGQLKETARMDAKPISAALNKLTEMRYVETIPGKGKNHLYRVKERFFNLWLIMTQGGPKQKRRVQYLTIFLEIWYGRDGLPLFLSDYRERLKRGEMNAVQAALMTTALARSSYVSAEDRDELIEHTRSMVAERKEYAADLPAKSDEACEKALAHLEAGRFKEAIDEANELEQETAEKDRLLAWAFGGLGDLVSCREYLSRTLALDQGATALNNAGFISHFINDHLLAEEYYLRAIAKDNESALGNLAILYQETGKPEQAEQLYLRAIDKGRTDGLYNLAILYQGTGKFVQAEQYYLRAIDKGHLNALNNLANLYRITNRPAEAEQVYLRAIDKGHLNALYNLATMYYVQAKPAHPSIGLLERLRTMQGGLDRDARTLFALLRIWSGSPGSAEPLTHLLKELLAVGSEPDRLAVWVKQFLVHHQTNQLWACFTSEDLGPALKERLQPLYFATAKLVGKAGEDAVRVMPTELAATVDEVQKNIEQMRKFYYPPAQ